MMFLPRQFLACALIGCSAVAFPAAAQIVTIGSGFSAPGGVAVDASGNVFVGDTSHNAVKEILAAGGYVTVNAIGSGFSFPAGVAIDRSGNIFVADSGNSAVKEILAAGGYVTVNTIGSGFNSPFGIAVDANDNVFVADIGNATVKEIVAAGGYVTVNTLGHGFVEPYGVAVDRSGNVFVADTGNGNQAKDAAYEILAAGGYITVRTLASGVFSLKGGVALDASENMYLADAAGVQELTSSGGYATGVTLDNGFGAPTGIVVDGSGNVFVADTGDNAVKEIMAAASPLVASVLPDSRSVQIGSPATVFASVINSGAASLANCRIALPLLGEPGLTLSYQTTNQNTNALTGTPNTPVPIAGSMGLQTFLISLQGTAAFTAPGMPLAFACDGAAPAANIIGVDTLDLVMSSTPVADIIALVATPTNNGIIVVPNGGAAAFAVASDNLGVTTTITVSVDTGTAVLPVTATICQSDASTGQCLAPPAGSVTLSYANGATPTFSIFLEASGAIAFAPAASRVFVRVKDASGGLHGSTSVAIESD